jgi:hypothetical protein
MPNHYANGLMGILLIAVLSMIGCETTESGSPAGSTGATPSPGSSMATATTSPNSRLAPAAGTAEDTLQACMARIPQDASPSQRMLAERTCQRDEEARQPFKGIPGR